LKNVRNSFPEYVQTNYTTFSQTQTGATVLLNVLGRREGRRFFFVGTLEVGGRNVEVLRKRLTAKGSGGLRKNE
jgi:hypothetical protein